MIQGQTTLQLPQQGNLWAARVSILLEKVKSTGFEDLVVCTVVDLSVCAGGYLVVCAVVDLLVVAVDESAV